MLGRAYSSQNCSIARSLEVVGERWTLLILRDVLLRRLGRFSQIQRSLGIASNTLSSRLDALVDAGVLEQVKQPDHPTRDEYRPTEKGRELVPVLVALTIWGDRWAAPLGPPISYHHTCGHPVMQALSCPNCRVDIDPGEIIVRPAKK